MNGLLGEQAELQRILAAIGELTQAFAIWLRAFITRAQQGARNAEAVAAEAESAFEEILARRLRGHGLGGGGNLVVSRERRLVLSRASELLLEVRLLLHLLAHQRRIEQTTEPAVERLAGILHAEELVLRATRVLFAARTPGFEQHFRALQRVQPEGQPLIAQILQLRDREQAARATGMPGHEHQLAVLRTGGGELQVVLNLRRLAVLVGAEETDIEVVARELEVVRVAAVERDLRFRREGEAHVRVFLETIEMIRTALPERDDVRAQTGLVERRLLDLSHDLAARGEGGGGRGILRNRGVDLRRHVLDGLQDVQLEVETLHLVRERLRGEAVAQIILLLRADLLESVRTDVMIRDQQSVLAHEAAGAAGIEAHGGLLQMLHPRVGGLELMAVLENLTRRLVEEPHAFIGQRGDRKRASQQGGENVLCHGAKVVKAGRGWRVEVAKD